MLITKPDLFSSSLQPPSKKKIFKKKLFSMVSIKEKVDSYDSFSWLVNF